MLIFGHTGITVGVAAAYAARRSRGRVSNETKPASGLAPKIDFRLVIVGSMLPDIIDKPLWLLPGGAYPSGHGYAHTLLLWLVLLGVGARLARRTPALLTIAVASLMHLAEDTLWLHPDVLLWPLRGPMAQAASNGWVSDLFESLLTRPQTYIPEIAGFIVLLVLAIRIIAARRVGRFLATGDIW